MLERDFQTCKSESRRLSQYVARGDSRSDFTKHFCSYYIWLCPTLSNNCNSFTQHMTDDLHFYSSICIKDIVQDIKCGLKNNMVTIIGAKGVKPTARLKGCFKLNVKN